MIFDRRILTKGYGRAFIESLPQCRISAGRTQEVFAGMEEFFEEMGPVFE